jgi:hypothetical protein
VVLGVEEDGPHVVAEAVLDGEADLVVETVLVEEAVLDGDDEAGP